MESRRLAKSVRVEHRRHRRRQEILGAAVGAFRDRGFHATTLDDIAARVGIRNTALYHYFPDKESILYACHCESLAEVGRVLERAEERCSSAADRLRCVIREHARVMTDSLEGSPFAFEVAALKPEHRAEVVAARDSYERALRQIISEGIATGEFRPVDPKLAVFAILGAVNWIARWYVPDGPTHGSELGDHFAEHLVKGLECQ